MNEIETIISFWLGTPDPENGIDPELKQRWFKKDPDFDQSIRDQFGSYFEKIEKGELDSWKADPRGQLALILVCDQFSRNAFRNQAQAFHYDPLSIAILKKGLASGADEKLSIFERVFYYMPLMHAESLELQNLGIRVFQKLVDDTPAKHKESTKQNLKYAYLHQEIIARFGRFPHRNETLGRESTQEEIEFLKTPGSSF